MLQLRPHGAWQVIKTPKGTTLDLPGVGVAHRVAQEWRAQGENLEPLEMPFTTLGRKLRKRRAPAQAFAERGLMLPRSSCIAVRMHRFGHHQERPGGLH